jgi:hypothetical protein
MLILFSAALFGFGVLLFSLGVAVWLIGLALRLCLWLFQLVLLIVWACIAFSCWIQQQRKAEVLEGEILPPESAQATSAAHTILGNSSGFTLKAATFSWTRLTGAQYRSALCNTLIAGVILGAFALPAHAISPYEACRDYLQQHTNVTDFFYGPNAMLYWAEMISNYCSGYSRIDPDRLPKQPTSHSFDDVNVGPIGCSYELSP